MAAPRTNAGCDWCGEEYERKRQGPLGKSAGQELTREPPQQSKDETVASCRPQVSSGSPHNRPIPRNLSSMAILAVGGSQLHQRVHEPETFGTFITSLPGWSVSTTRTFSQKSLLISNDTPAGTSLKLLSCKLLPHPSPSPSSSSLLNHSSLLPWI